MEYNQAIKPEAKELTIKDRQNIIKRPGIANTGKSFEPFDKKSGGKKYVTQFTITEKKEQEFTDKTHQIAVYVTFTQTAAKKGINMHGEL